MRVRAPLGLVGPVGVSKRLDTPTGPTRGALMSDEQYIPTTTGIMAENCPPTPSVTSTPSSSTATSSAGRPLSWSLQNFPVPVQLQARIPTSPLSVAQELLPNFPSHLMESPDPPAQQENSHQYYLSLQQQMQQQLQQQFQRQLQLNLQGGSESSRGFSMPDPPETTLDIDLPGGPRTRTTPSNNNNNDGNDNTATTTTNRNWGGLRGALNSANLGVLEALFRNSNSPHSHSHSGGSSSNTIAGGHRRTGSSESGLVSRHPISTATGSHVSHSQTSTVPRHFSSHHHHDDLRSALQAVSGETSGDGLLDSSSRIGGGSDLAGGGSNTGNGGGGNQTANAPGGIQNSAELTLLYKWLTESGIFVILLLLHFLYDHRLGLLVFLCTGGTFYYTNMKLVHAIHLSAVRDSTRSWPAFLNLLWLSGFLLANVIILYYVFAEQKLWGLLLYQMAVVQDISVWTLLWCVIMTDYIIKFITVIFKAVLAMLQPCFSNYRQRGKYYLLIESISQFYRQSVTIVPWLFYLNDSTRTSLWFAFITEAVYLGFKGWSMWKSVQFLYSSLCQFQSHISFGKKPSASDLLERGNQCPICQDSVKDPVMLPCKHIFCEQCVSIWFDREKTCPMCRAQITSESPLWKDGNTSAHLQWH